MATRPLATSQPLVAFLIGLVGALAAVVWHVTGLDRRGELYALDLRFKHASSAKPPDNILHVDIDDRSLAEIGRWPWPRQTLARIVSVLNECGARTVVLDIIMPERQKRRLVAEEDIIYGADENQTAHQEESKSHARPKVVLDDVALAQTIRRCGNVLVPIHVDFETPEAPPLLEPLKALLAKTPDMTAQRAAERLGRDEDDVRPVISRARQEAIGSRVSEILNVSPQAPFLTVLAQILPDLSPRTTTRECDIVENAYLRHRAVAALARFTVPPEQVADGRIDNALLTPPLVSFARSIHGSGFVTFLPDPDKAMRRIPLLARSDGRVYPQFALATAVDELARRHGGACKIEADTDTVTLRCTDGTTRSIPVDSDGWMLIHWAQGTWPPKPRAPNRPRISAASVGKISQERQRLLRLRNQVQALGADLLKIGVRPVNDRLTALSMTYQNRGDESDNAHLASSNAREQMHRALYDPTREIDPAKLDELARADLDSKSRLVNVTMQIVAGLRQGRNMDVFLGKPDGGGGADDRAWAGFQARKDATDDMLALYDRLVAEANRTEANIAQLEEELVEIVKGKICMIGSTSTGAADFVACPLAARTPGVVVHSNIIDTILDGRFIHEAHWSVDLLAILVAGAAVSAAAALRPVVQAAAGTVVLGGAYVLFNAFVVFGAWSVWLTAVAPLAAMVASFLVVTAYRQITEERGKRQLKAMLVQTLSPEVVEEVLKDPSLLSPGGQKSAVSCMFSDLAGFTPLSEILGPQETVLLLNRYFDGATDAIANRWGGWVNKFLGDGIFAIFGVPVRPERHAARAVEAAIDCQDAVGVLNAELTREAGVDVQLSVRIGITTGEAMVGNCGSTTKADLTAIGSCVNQASRLEASNKSFGTRIIVASETWAACDRDALLARPLGRVFLVGVSEAVRVWHVLGRAETLGEELRPVLDDFARAMELFCEADFTGALALLEKFARAMPDDKAAAYYMDLCRQCAAHLTGDKEWRAVHSIQGVARAAMPWQELNPNEHTK